MSKWSFSGLKDFESCARKYHEVKVLQRYPREDSAQSIYGKQLHSAAEEFVRDGTPLPTEFGFLLPVLEAVRAKEGTVLCELEMALKQDLTPCPFLDDDYWVRGIADVVIINKRKQSACVLDYKSGSDKYADTGQLVLMALLLFRHFPKLKVVYGGLLFVLRGTMQTRTIRVEDAPEHWAKYRSRVKRIDAAHEHGQWPPSQSGLCRKHCVVTTCEFNGRN